MLGCSALSTIAANFEPGHDDVEPAIPLNLSLQSVEQVTFDFSDLAATEARHVNVIALGTPLIVVFLALHVHQIEFVNQTVPL